MDPIFHELQLMAKVGHIVFYDNHRGSLSYGEDFALLLQYKYSSEEDSLTTCQASMP